MLMPTRNSSIDGYRYGFNGKEKDDEVKGEGVIYDYGFRIYDPRIAKFLSEDPLSPSYPMLTPYQFASNTPIQAIDIDGLEGETYLEYKIENGERVVLGRVVEVDLYVAVSRDRNQHFFSRNERKDEKVRQKMTNDLASQYVDGEFNDGDGNPIIWRFNVETFVVDDVSIDDFRERLREDIESTFVEGINDERTGIKAMIIQQQHISDLPSFNKETEMIENIGNSDTRGEYDGGFITTLNDAFEDGLKGRRHTLGHEIAHFLLRLHPNELIQHMGDSAENHDLAGEGILHYYDFLYTIKKAQITSDNKSPFTVTSTPRGRQDLNQENVNNFLQSIIDTGEREIQQE